MSLFTALVYFMLLLYICVTTCKSKVIHFNLQVKKMKVKTIVVAGATGAVGEGLVAHFLREGYYVIAPIRSEQKGDDLKRFLKNEQVSIDRLTCIINAFSNDQEVEDLSASLAQYEIDATVASLGGWYQGEKLYDMTQQNIQKMIDGGMVAHLNFARAVAPHLIKKNDSNYIMINGGASEFVVPGSGIVSVLAAAQKMMASVLAEELKPSNVHVYTVAAFDMIKTRKTTNENLWLSTDKIADYILKIANDPKVEKVWHVLAKPEDLEL